MNPITTASAIQLSSLIVTSGLGIYGIWRRIDKRQHSFDIEQAVMMQKIDYITNQFGPNGGGLRQAVNDMSRKIDSIDARVNVIATDLSETSGRFDQHIIESRN